MQLKFCQHGKKVFAVEFLEDISPDVPAKTSVADMQNFKSSPFVSSVVVMSSLVIRASMLLVFTSTA